MLCEDSKSYQYLFLFPAFNSKESPPTLASKVDQLEGLLKMLQEDLRKVSVSSTEGFVRHVFSVWWC